MEILLLLYCAKWQNLARSLKHIISYLVILLLLLSILSKDTGSTKGKPVRGAPRLYISNY